MVSQQNALEIFKRMGLIPVSININSYTFDLSQGMRNFKPIDDIT